MTGPDKKKRAVALPPPATHPDPHHPRYTRELLEHATAEAAFTKAWNSSRAGHAWLISGPRGIGKATLAYRLARRALYHERPKRQPALTPLLDIKAPEPPFDDVLFRKVAGASHGNLLVLERGYDERRRRLRREILVEEARRIGSFLHHTGNEPGWRVVLIDGADSMNIASQNAVLKLLEEPPTGALLLLTADNAGAVLPTLRSRCRRLALAPLADATVAVLLARYAPDLPAAGQAALVRLSDGSIGRALELAASGGSELYNEILLLFSRLPDNIQAADIHAFADRLTRNGDQGWLVAAELIIGLLARAILDRVGRRQRIDQEERVALGRLILLGDLEYWLDVWEKVSQLFERADTASFDRRQVMLSAVALMTPSH